MEHLIKGNDTAVLVNGDVTVKATLKNDEVLDLRVYRKGKMICSRELGPQVDYDD